MDRLQEFPLPDLDFHYSSSGPLDNRRPGGQEDEHLGQSAHMRSEDGLSRGEKGSLPSGTVGPYSTNTCTVPLESSGGEGHWDTSNTTHH